MRPIKRLFQITLTAILMTATLVAQQPLPITRVLLAKNGMAYIVRSGSISAPLSLTFHPEDMNDVLKSFSAWNPENGTLYSVGYTTGIPSSQMLGRYPFNLTGADVGLGAFLAQVKGAAVRLDTGAKPLEGKLLAAQQTDHVLQQQTSTSDYRLTVLLADGSIQTVWLSEVRSVEFPDAALRDQLKQYLEVLSEGRQDVTRQVSIYPSQGAGPVRVAYLQQFPLWKTSYRMDLGPKESQIQGWAQIDNPTGESWENVEVSLLSGSPVSFVMNLYQPLFTNRASVAVPGGQVAAPRQYESSLREASSSVGIVLNEAQIAGLPLYGNDPLTLIQTLPGYRANPIAQQFDTLGGLALTMTNSARDGLSFGGAGGTFQGAQTTEIQDFFEYQFPFPVQLAGRQSALLPFLQKAAPTERLSIYNPAADRGNPRLGVRIENNTGTPFEPGPVTFFEAGRYAGEAVLAYLPRSEKRLVSYGVDYDIQVAAKPKAEPETTVRITAVKGIVTQFRESLLTTTYEIRNKGTQAKTLIVEHPRQNNRKLKGGEPWETTDNYYRFRISLAPGETAELTPAEIVSRTTGVQVNRMNREQFVSLFSGTETPRALRDQLGTIVDMQERIATIATERKEADSKVSTLFRDQDRLRENLKALRDTGEEKSLRSRYLSELLKQEDEITALRKHSEALQVEITTAQAGLADRIENLAWQ